MSGLRLALGGWRVPACKKRPARSVQTLVAVLAQLEHTSRQREISPVNSPKWQTFVSSRLMLCRVSARHLKEPLFVKPESTPRADGAHGCFSGAATGSTGSGNWEQRSGNWEQKGSSPSRQEGACAVGWQPPGAWPHEGMCCFRPAASCGVRPGRSHCWQWGASEAGK